jgi:hypothetical protein
MVRHFLERVWYNTQEAGFLFSQSEFGFKWGPDIATTYYKNNIYTFTRR